MATRDKTKNKETSHSVEKAMKDLRSDGSISDAGAGHAAKQQLRHEKDLNRAIPENEPCDANPGKKKP